MNYGRALESAGRSEEAVEQLSRAAEISTDPITRRLAVSNLAYIFGRMGRYDEALDQVAVLRQLSRSCVAADIAEGRTRLAMGQTEEGLALLSRIPPNARDDDGMEYDPHMVAAIHGEALASLGRFGEAADVVLEAMRSAGVLEADIGELVRWLLGASRSPAEIASALTEADLVAMLGRMLRQPPPLADVLIEGAWARFPDRLEPLAAAARIAPELPVARALQWSSRLARARPRRTPVRWWPSSTATRSPPSGSGREPRHSAPSASATSSLASRRRSACSIRRHAAPPSPRSADWRRACLTSLPAASSGRVDCGQSPRDLSGGATAPEPRGRAARRRHRPPPPDRARAAGCAGPAASAG